MKVKNYCFAALVIVSLLSLSSCSMMSAGGGRNNQPEMSAEQHESLGDAHFSQGQFELAFMDYSKALAANPENNAVRMKKGRLLTRQGLHAKALVEYQEVFQRDPANGLAHMAAGQIYFSNGLYKQAASHFRKALAADAGQWKGHMYLGVIANYDGDFDTALTHLDAALALQPDNGEILNNLAITWSMNNDLEKAAAYFGRALRAGPSPDSQAIAGAAGGKAFKERVCNNLGVALARLGKYEQSLEAFRVVGNDAGAYNNLGYVLFLEGRHKEAVEYFEKAMQLSPTYYTRADGNLKRAKLAVQFSGAGPGMAAAPHPPVPDTPKPDKALPRTEASPVPAAVAKPAPAPLPAAEERTVPGENVSTVAPAPVAGSVGTRVADAKPVKSQSRMPRKRGLSLIPDSKLFRASLPAVHSVASDSVASDSVASGPVASGSAKASPVAAQAKAMNPEARYTVYVSSWQTLEKAEAQMNALRSRGYDARIVAVNLPEQGVWHRVTIGAYADYAKADSERLRLAEELDADTATIMPLVDPDGNNDFRGESIS